MYLSTYIFLAHTLHVLYSYFTEEELKPKDIMRVAHN